MFVKSIKCVCNVQFSIFDFFDFIESVPTQEKRKGNETKVGYQKICINEDWWKWNHNTTQTRKNGSNLVVKKLRISTKARNGILEIGDSLIKYRFSSRDKIISILYGYDI